MNKITYKVIFSSLIVFFVGYALDYFLNAYIASNISPSLFGDFSLAFKLLVLAGPLYLLGMPSSVIKYISKFHSLNDIDSIQKFLKWSITTCTKLSLIFMPFFFIILCFIFILDHFQLQLFEYHHAAIYFQILAPLISAALLLCSFLMSFQKILSVNFITQILKNIILIICFFVLFSMMNSTSIHAIHLMYCIGAGLFIWLVIITYVFIHNKYIGNHLKRALTKKISETDVSLILKWSSYGKKILINSTIFTLVSFLDLLIIEIIPHYGEHNVGYYAACLTISSLIHVTRRGVFNVLQPFFAAAKNEKSMQLIATMGFKFLSAVIIFQCLIFVVFAKLFLSFFGPSYTHISTVLRILIIGLGVSMMPTLSILYLLYEGYEKVLLKANYFIFISTLVFGSLGYYFYGLIGIALVISLIFIVQAFALFLIVKQKTPIKFMWII